LRTLNLPLTEEIIASLHAKEQVLISGYIYTARDQAHKRLYELIQKNLPLPMEIKNQIIYYAGPCPTKPGRIIGSIGPTTSKRMDAFTPILLEHGLKGMIGKGARSKEVVQSIIDNKAIYFAALGGTGALISECIEAYDMIAYPELGTEAIYRLKVKNFPVIVVNDIYGQDAYVIN
jgi:fumarate hydratase subunit beta